MGDDRTGGSLSQRVPGATNRPKPLMRVAPPVLPDALIDRLRAEAATAAASDNGQAELPPGGRGQGAKVAASEHAPVPEPAAVPQPQPKPLPGARRGRGTRARPRRGSAPAERSLAVKPAASDAAASATPATSAGAGTVTSLPVRPRLARPVPTLAAGVAAFDTAAAVSDADVPARVARSAGGGVSAGDAVSTDAVPRPSKAAADVPDERPLAPRSPTGQVPPPVTSLPRRVGTRPAPQLTAAPAAAPEPGPITEPIPVIADPSEVASGAVGFGTSLAATRQPVALTEVAADAVAAPAVRAVPAGPAPAAPRARRQALTRSRPALVNRIHPAPPESAPTMLRPLFADSDRGPVEEAVASVREDVARGRTTHDARRFRSVGVIVAVGLAILVVLVLLVVG